MAEIAWRPWSEDVFVEAQQQNKPVVLFLTAPWCQFCKAMEEQTYGNEAIARYVSDNFIPVRVDTDKRPEVNTRYAQGGWPSNCILTPEGDVLWGGTFLNVEQASQLLPQVKSQFDNNKAGVAQHVAQLREQIRRNNTPPALDTSLQITPDIPVGVLLALKHNFDFAFGGFGHNTNKFPHPDAIELTLEQFNRSVQAGVPDEDLATILEKTLSGIADGELRDKGAGGFFRYTQTPDWREPQVEKLLEDSATLARTFSRAYQVLQDDRWKEIAEETLRYMDEVLYDSSTGAWGGSQFADAEYYSQPLAERAEWNPPTVDPTVYTGPNAQAVRAHVAWWAATGDAAALKWAKKGMDFLLENALKADGALDHFVPQGEDADFTGRVPTGLLSDSARMVAACLDLYEAGMGVTYLDKAEEVANWVKGHLEDPRAGGLQDAIVRPDAVGNLKVPTRDVADNMQMADALLRLFLATGDEEHAQMAQRVLQAFLPALPQLGLFGATYALAAERALLPPVLVHVLGPLNDKKTIALLEAAHRPYRFERFVVPLDPTDENDAEYIKDLEYEMPETPVAYVNIATIKLDPTTEPETLTEQIRNAMVA
ncbi:MAG: hypothetical protein OHK0029_03680 [Armatimonadaceae bacterium]